MPWFFANRSGASGNTGMDFIARSAPAPDGDTTADYASFLAKDYASYGVIVKEAKISLD